MRLVLYAKNTTSEVALWRCNGRPKTGSSTCWRYLFKYELSDIMKSIFQNYSDFVASKEVFRREGSFGVQVCTVASRREDYSLRLYQRVQACIVWTDWEITYHNQLQPGRVGRSRAPPVNHVYRLYGQKHFFCFLCHIEKKEQFPINSVVWKFRKTLDKSFRLQTRSASLVEINQNVTSVIRCSLYCQRPPQKLTCS